MAYIRGMELSHSKPESTLIHQELDVKQVIGDVAGSIAMLTAKGFNEETKTAIVDNLLSVISNITKYSRQMELQVELGTSREHEAIRLLEKFKKIAKQQKTIIDAMTEEERQRSAIKTISVDTNTSLTGVDMIAQEDELTNEISALRDRLTRRMEECRKLGSALKKSEKSEKKLRRIVQRSQEIMQAQEALMQGSERATDQYIFDAEGEQHYHGLPSHHAEENRLYVSADSESLKESTAPAEYEYSNKGVRRGNSAGFPPPIKPELPPSDPPQNQYQYSDHLNDMGANENSYGVYNESKARTRMDERKIFEMTEAEIRADFDYHDSSSPMSPDASGTGTLDEGQEQRRDDPEGPGTGETSQARRPHDSQIDHTLSAVARSPPRAVISSSPTRSPRSSPLRSSVDSKSPRSPKEAIFNFVEEAAQQEESELDLSFVASKDQRSRETSPEKALSLVNESVRSDSNNDRDISVSTLKSSPERSDMSHNPSSPFEDVDSLEDSFSMIQKYY